MSLKTKLARMKKQENKVEKVDENEIPFLDKWQTLDTQQFCFEEDYCLVRERHYPLSYQHGVYVLGDFLHACELWQTASINHPLSCKGYKANDLFFFDTETTGLSQGAGTAIFLLGHARFEEDKIIVRQHFLPHIGSEIAMYQSFLENVDYTTLVTYNGKSFDWPKVKARHTLLRHHIPQLPSFGHFDLYHSARRMWKDELESVRLSIVEKEILGIQRENDIPGFLAPAMYFDFVETKNPESIFGIFEHNEQDVLSLICLYTHLTYTILQERNISNRETFEIGRWLATLGEKEEAIVIYEQSLTSQTDKRTNFALSMLYKRTGKWQEAVSLWKEICCEEKENKIDTLIELAKYYEHREKNYKQAFAYADEAYKQLEVSGVFKEKWLGEKLNIEKRMERLKKKLKKYNS